MLEPLGLVAHEALAPKAGERILDIGCGTGATTIALATDVGPSGAVVGVDVSATLLEVARRRADGIASVSFVEADAQVHAFDETFDGAFSRFGVMFFEDPAAAFANIASALRSGGRLVFVCWQDPAANEWWTVGARTAERHNVELPPLTDPNAPGPFAFSDANRLRGILDGAGFADVALTETRRRVVLGGHGSVDTAVGFLRRSRLGAAIIEATADEAGAEAVFADMTDAFAPYLTPRGVEMTAVVWLATARRP
jgi:SAM-dependent methyltransferase